MISAPDVLSVAALIVSAISLRMSMRGSILKTQKPLSVVQLPKQIEPVVSDPVPPAAAPPLHLYNPVAAPYWDRKNRVVVRQKSGSEE
jgi:hypothetical protein